MLSRIIRRSRAPRNERFREGDVFRRVFERIVETCIAAGLVGGEGFAVDASLIQADANKQRSIAGQDWCKDRDPKGRQPRCEGVSGDSRGYGLGGRYRRYSEVCLAIRSCSPVEPAAERLGGGSDRARETTFRPL
jgi:hypothetical protein